MSRKTKRTLLMAFVLGMAVFVRAYSGAPRMAPLQPPPYYLD